MSAAVEDIEAPEKPKVLVPDFAGIPAELIGMRRWLVWENRLVSGKGGTPRYTKVPKSGSGGVGKSNDATTWSDFSAVVVAYNRKPQLDGVGVTLGPCGNGLSLIGIDADSCIGPDRAVAEWAMPLVKLLSGTFGEYSPSESGIKSYVFCRTEDVEDPEVRRAFDLEDGKDGFKRGIVGLDGGNHGPAIEVYSARHFFAMTGHRHPDFADKIAIFSRAQVMELAKLTPKRGAVGNDNGIGTKPDDSRSAKAFGLGAKLKREGLTKEEIWRNLADADNPDILAWVDDKGRLDTADGKRQLENIWKNAGISLHDFYAYMPMHNYIHTPSRQTWPPASVNARLSRIALKGADGKELVDDKGKPRTVSATVWLDRHRPVELMTWAPGLPLVVHNKLILEGGWIDHPGASVFNLYRPPQIGRDPGDPTLAGPWLDHIRFVYPDEADHIINWLAQRVQHPEVKINHALVLAGGQGIGKDTLLEPVKYAVGPWNFEEVSPKQMLERYNSYLKSVVLRINEARDLGESDRFAFYDHMKACTAAPPDTLRVNEKHLREYAVVNCCGVILTTNHKTDGIYLPADDRRHFVAWSTRTKEDKRFQDGYWNEMWSYYGQGGLRHVAAYLRQHDLTGFDAKAPPPKTDAFWAIVDANRPAEETEFADAIDELGNPEAFTLGQLAKAIVLDELVEWLNDRRNRRMIPYRLEQCGYSPVRNFGAPSDGLWKLNGKRQAIYAQTVLSPQQRVTAAKELQVTLANDPATTAAGEDDD